MCMRQVILFLSDKSDDYVIKQFRALELARKPMVQDVFFLFHQKTKETPTKIKWLSSYSFFSDILNNMKYTPLSDQLLPGNNHFPLLKYFLENPDYDYYWIVEDDVYFCGNWNEFFNEFTDNVSDFISTYIKKYDEEPNWPWWNSLRKDKMTMTRENMLHSFNPVYRISRKALEYIHEKLLDGWCGHHEVLFPTLLAKAGYTIFDLKYSSSVHSFYDSESYSHLQLKPQTYRDKMLYHPIKEKIASYNKVLKRNCVISAVGNNSLHKQWLPNEKESTFDLHLIVYDQSFQKYYNDSNFISYKKGYKMKLVYDYLCTHPEYLEHYKYFFIPDDDISTDICTIEKLFEMMEAYNLEIAQPALINSYYTFPHTLRDKTCVLRYVNFVEIMIPCFSQKALKLVLPTFNANESGWGIENHWPILINTNLKDIAVIDSVPMIHTRPIQSYSEKNMKELYDYLKVHNLKRVFYEYGFISVNKQSYSDRIQYKSYLNLLKSISNRVKIECSRIQIDYIGLNGGMGMALFLSMYSRLSEDKQSEELAIELINHLGKYVYLINENMNFMSGLPGFCWGIEWLVQSQFISDNSNDILEEVCQCINSYTFTYMNDLSSSQLVDLKSYYQLRINNSNNASHPLYLEEMEILLAINERLEENNSMIGNIELLIFNIYQDLYKKENNYTDSPYYKLLKNGWELLYIIYRKIYKNE